jgi:hypothetical protein
MQEYDLIEKYTVTIGLIGESTVNQPTRPVSSSPAMTSFLKSNAPTISSSIICCNEQPKIVLDDWPYLRALFKYNVLPGIIVVLYWHDFIDVE